MERNKLLAELRKKRALSQDEVAEQMGVSRQTVYRWERGTAIPSNENLKGLSKLYGVSMDVLVHCGELPPEAPPAPQPEPVPVPGARKWKIIAGVCMGIIVILLAVLISMGMRETSGAPYIPIKNMQENEVSPTPNTGFDFGA